MKLVNIKIGKKFKDGYIFDLSFDVLPFMEIYLCFTRYVFHINKKHKIDLFMIKDILTDPDYIIKGKGRNRRIYHFRKMLNDNMYTAIVLRGDGSVIPKNKGYLLSAYLLTKDSTTEKDVVIYDLWS